MNYTRDMNDGKTVFVFGSNTAGRHGAGAALTAVREWGARYGIGQGRTGQAYAIPTKDEELKVLSLPEIKQSVLIFLEYARKNPNIRFLVTAIGCGLAGYSERDIKPMFEGAPANCMLPAGWIQREPKKS